MDEKEEDSKFGNPFVATLYAMTVWLISRNGKLNFVSEKLLQN